jgi:transcriptional regulator GlxA family with amidase domain
MQKVTNMSYNIALLDYPGAQRSALYGLADLFQLSGRVPAQTDAPRLKARIIGRADLDTDAGWDAFIFPPSIEAARGAPDSPFCRWAQAQHTQGALAMSVCAGAFWLGHAGLLGRRPATTHWALEDEFRTTFPDVDLRPDQLLVDDLDVVTAGGLMAWLDLGLFVVGRQIGAQAVTELARNLLIDPGGREQRHYSGFRPRRSHGDTAVMAVQRHVEQNPDADLSVTALAAIARLGDRTFLRRFSVATGLTPGSYVQALRIEKARTALESGPDSVAEVAWAVGYQDVSAFTRVFAAQIGLTPGAYRRKFGTLAYRQARTAHAPL